MLVWGPINGHEFLMKMYNVIFYMWNYTKEWAFRTILSLLILKMMTIYHMYVKYSLQKLLWWPKRPCMDHGTYMELVKS